MCNLEQFKIDLKALSEGETPLEWAIDDSFFQQLEGAQLQRGSLHVSGSIRKTTGFYELMLHAEGHVVVPCDRCLDDMEQPIDTDTKQGIRLGIIAADAPQSDDDILTVDQDKGVLDTAWLIYETIALAVPIQHVHHPGECNDAMTRKLNELSADRSSDADATPAIDPRWSELLKLKH